MNGKRLLVIGAPRSGTTLLCSMVGRHPDVGMLAEGFYQEEDKFVGKPVVANKLCVPNQIKLETPFVTGKDRVLFWIGTWFYKVGLRVRMRAMPTPLWRPSPDRYKSISEYLKLENSRILSIVRDPNAVVQSIMDRGGKSFEEALHRWQRAVEVTDELQRNYSSRVHVVGFESLVTETESELKKICSFLELTYEPVMLNGMKYNPMGSEYQHGDIDSSRAQKDTPEYEIEEKCPHVYTRYKNICS